MPLTYTNGLMAGRGVVLLGAVGATPPTLSALETYVAGNLATPPASWAPFGDADPEELPSFDSDGGDMKVLSTWAFANVVEIPDGDPKVNYFTVNAIEFADATMKLYEGGRAGTPAAGIFWAPGLPVPTLSGVTVVFIDKALGQVKGYHAPKMSIRGDGGVTLNSDTWSRIPLRFTELTHPGATGPHAWIGSGFTATP